jgi:hypothetical protein
VTKQGTVVHRLRGTAVRDDGKARLGHAPNGAPETQEVNGPLRSPENKKPALSEGESRVFGLLGAS